MDAQIPRTAFEMQPQHLLAILDFSWRVCPSGRSYKGGRSTGREGARRGRDSKERRDDQLSIWQVNLTWRNLPGWLAAAVAAMAGDEN